MSVTAARIDDHRRQLSTRCGRASVIDTGGTGRPALFVHGLATSSYLWRNVIEGVKENHRCVAIDLPLHGQTPAEPGQDLSLPGLADFVAECCNELELADIDLVANDTGGAIAQVFAVSQPERLHTLTLTNCETHNNVPPRGLRAAYWLARGEQAFGTHLLARLAPMQVRTAASRRRFYRFGYEDSAYLSDDIAQAWLDPLMNNKEAATRYLRMFTSIRARDLLAIDSALLEFCIPTLIVWGTADKFFDRKWAYRLRDTIPGASEVVEIDGGRLLFPDERAVELTAALRRHWDAHP